MPKQTRTTPEQLQAQADELARQAAEVQAELDRISLEEYEREQQAQAERDQETIDSFDRAALDQAVDEARARFDTAVAEMPVTKALADYIAAGYRRSWAHQDLSAARSRLGLGESGNPPHPAHVQPWQEAIATVATRIAQTQIDAERSQA
jgi:hypothetical protein